MRKSGAGQMSSELQAYHTTGEKLGRTGHTAIEKIHENYLATGCHIRDILRVLCSTTEKPRWRGSQNPSNPWDETVSTVDRLDDYKIPLIKNSL